MVEQAWLGSFSTKSDFARSAANYVAAAASMDLITTRLGPNRFGRAWRPTPKGLRVLFKHRGWK